MISASHLFEDFGETANPETSARNLDIETLEDQKLQAFEKGYQAGWDDAIKAQIETGRHISAGLAASLQDASFEYHEVRSTLNRAVQDILSEIIQTLLPQVARDSLGAHIKEQVSDMVKSGSEHTLSIVVAPEAKSIVESILADDASGTFEVAEDPLLSPTQAVLRLGPTEREIDLERVVESIAENVTAFFETTQEPQHE